MIHVQPEYYAMMMFAQAAPPGSQLVNVAQTPAAGVNTWATRTSGGVIHAVIVNKRSSGYRVDDAGRPAGQRTGDGRDASRAAPVHSTGDVTLDGQTFRHGDEHRRADRHPPTDTEVAPVTDQYTVDVPAGERDDADLLCPSPACWVNSLLSGDDVLIDSW